MSEGTSETPQDSAVAAIVAGNEPKLWAGKYKSVEDLEEAYKHSAKVFNENEELKKRYEQATTVPEAYTAPDGISLRENELHEINQIAKSAGLTQAQYEKTAREMEGRIKAQREGFERARSEIGNERLVILEDYVKKTFPESLQQPVINHIIKDKKAMDDALKHRDSLLNSTVPGMDKAGAGAPKSYDGQSEVAKAAEEYRRNPTQANRNKYINIAAEVGNERFK